MCPRFYIKLIEHWDAKIFNTTCHDTHDSPVLHVGLSDMSHVNQELDDFEDDEWSSYYMEIYFLLLDWEGISLVDMEKLRFLVSLAQHTIVSSGLSVTVSLVALDFFAPARV